MINFRLDPMSGYADSYLDIKFTAKFDMTPTSEIRIYNDTTGSNLEILSVSHGYIASETLAIVKNSTQIEGYINLFNKDKTNSGLRSFVGVDIRCEVISYNDDGEKIETQQRSVTFYNQSQSLDGNIIPFDLIVVNGHIDIQNHVPLKLHVVSDRESRYELCIRTEDGTHSCTIEVIAKNGTTSIEVPSEIIWSDLELSQLAIMKKFDIYWTKFEGVNHMKFLNRKYIKIDNTRLTFSHKDMIPQATNRIGPTGEPLSDDFVLSDRYFVHTLKHWSRYGGAVMGFGTQRLNKLTAFWHESQNMHSVETAIKTFDAENAQATGNDKEIKKALWHQRRSEIIRSRSSKHKKELLSGLSNIYTKRTVQTMSTDLNYVSGPSVANVSPARAKKPGGCGCSRKKNG